LEWDGQDEWGISHYDLTFDDKHFEMGSDTTREIQVTEGEHRLIIDCYDLAGNVRSISWDIIVDMTPPEVSFKNRSSGHINRWRNIIEWSIFEEVGLRFVNLTIDGTEYKISTEAEYYPIDFGEGEHRIIIEVTDIVGFISSDQMMFYLDMTEPEIEGNGFDLDRDTVTIFWEIEETAENLSWEIFLDTSMVNIQVDVIDGSFKIAELAPGNHTIRMRVEDLAGNSKMISWNFMVEEEENIDTTIESGGGWIWILLIVILVITAGLGLLLWVRSRKKERPKKISEASRKPDRITINHIPAPHSRPLGAPAVQPEHHSIHRPAPREGQAIHQRNDEAYIRPEVKKRPQKKIVVNAPEPKTAVKQQVRLVVKKKLEKPAFTPPHLKEDKENVEEWGQIEDWEGEEVEDWAEMEEI
ncbi:MAG: hypothetical protein U9R75_06730, partial [Candidatus Thermoplasmatota archaeon]|nr:hypothetical protein [Candidatus Thermoplasmatota archaeon]